MEKTAKVVCTILLIALIVCLIPLPMHYKDGGSVGYKAVLYEVTKWHYLSMLEPDGYYDGLEVKIIGITVLDTKTSQVSSGNLQTTAKNCKVTVVDDQGLLIEKPDGEYFAPGTVLTFRSGVICDADLAMYVNGEFVCIQNAVDTGDGYVWEYSYEVDRSDLEIEFRIEGTKGF